MTISLKHATQATGSDQGNGDIHKSQWNEEHTITMATGKLLGRTTASTGAVEEISPGARLTLAGGTLSADAIGTTINTQTASYTLVLGDANKLVEMNVASANNLTIPPNSSVAFATETIINVTQLGAGQTTLNPGAGVTIRSRNGLKLAGQYAVATLYKRGTDEWVAGGDLTT